MKYRVPVLVVVILVAIGVAVWATWGGSPPAPATNPLATNAHDARPATAVLDGATVAAPREAHERALEQERLERMDAQELLAPMEVSGPRLTFVLTGVAPGECHGQAFLRLRDAPVQLVPITGPELAVPLDDRLRRVEIVVEGYSIAEYTGPFIGGLDPIDVALRRAGTLLVHVTDVHGRALANRLVYCYPLVSEPGEGMATYRTTTWGFSNDRGLARVENVIPGEYRVDTAPLAQWLGATTENVVVTEAAAASCNLIVPTLDPDTYGGFDIARRDAGFLVSTAGGVVKEYRFWSENDQGFKLYCVDEVVRCVVHGRMGDVVRGCIQVRGGDGSVELSLNQSDVITVTIGAVVLIRPTWWNALRK